MKRDELMALPWNRDTTRLPTISPPENWRIGELPWNVGKHSMLWTPTPGLAMAFGPGLGFGWVMALAGLVVGLALGRLLS